MLGFKLNRVSKKGPGYRNSFGIRLEVLSPDLASSEPARIGTKILEPNFGSLLSSSSIESHARY